ncbi:hypothetical protein I3F58_24495 [Streptomyces sp. MUM 203J]|uniref:hypothetical protein n=1 Tax=Streptomyces sp. MUM 203J TaxID=2791990 RepID=UPI001F03FDE3|nr:hypothetical protein [Streptomyces sp. MUM 203J]MCH0542661.1 hypothetical protein [Streptomyces sp. MUM 203J]
MTEAVPTPEEIEYALRLQDEYQQTKPRNEAEGRAVAARIFGDWQSAQEQGGNIPDLLSFVRDVAENGAVTSEERGSTRAFWSFKSQPEGASRVVEHRFLAQACGATRGYQVLEDTPAGQQLDSYHLWDREVQRALVRDYELDQGEVDDTKKYVWSTVSERYAQAAEGPVAAFATDITEGSVLGHDELPILLAHEMVGKEGVNFPLAMPRHEHLPPEVDVLIADPPIRAQIRMEDFDPEKSPKEFAAKLAALDIPENQREAVEGALWRLSTANSYDELADKAAKNEATQPQKGSAFTVGSVARPAAQPAAPRGPTGHGVINPTVAPPELTPAAHSGIEH